MRTIIFCICADQALRSSLDAIALEKEYGQVGHGEQYLAPGESFDVPVTQEITSAIAFVSLDKDLEAGLNTVKILEKIQRPQMRVVAASSTRDPDELLRIVRAGVGNFMPLPATRDDVEAVLDKISDEQSSANGRNGRVFLFMGASGGAGTTTVAVHTAVALAAVPNRRTLLIDLHRELGHAGLYLYLKNAGHSFEDVIAGLGHLDSALLDSFLVTHESGLSVLCSPDRYVRGTGHFDPKSVKRAVDFLKEQFDYIIIDSNPQAPDSDSIANLANMVYLVVSAEVAPLRDLTRYVEHFGKDPAKFHVVVTNEGKSVVTSSHISSKVNLPVVARFSSQLGPEVATAVNAGRTISLEVRDFHDPLSDILNHIEPMAVVPAPKTGLFGWRKK